MTQLIDFLTHPAALAVLIPLVGGLLGTALETLGERWKKPGLVALGQRIEGLLADLPKLIRGSRKTAEEKGAKPKDPPKSDPPRSTPIPPIVAMLSLGLLGCSAAQEPPPCDAASYALLSANCGDDADVCNAKIEERERFCADKIRSGQ